MMGLPAIAGAAEPAPLTKGDCDCSPMDMTLQWARVESDESSTMLIWRCQSSSNGKTHWVDSRIYQYDEPDQAAESFALARAAFSQAVEWSSQGQETSRLVSVVDEPDRFGSLRYFPIEHLYWGEMTLKGAPTYYAVFHMSYTGIDENEARDIFEAAARRILLTIDSKTLAGGITLPTPEEGAIRLGITNFTAGTVELQRPPSTEWASLTAGSPLFSGDKIRTSKGSRAEVLLGSSRIIGVGPETMIALSPDTIASPTDPLPINLARGRMWVLIDPLARLPFTARIRTADVMVEAKDPASSEFEGIDAIEFDLRAEGGASFVNVLDGIVWISDTAGTEAAVDAGKSVRAESGGTLSAPKAFALNEIDRWWASFPHAPTTPSPGQTSPSAGQESPLPSTTNPDIEPGGAEETAAEMPASIDDSDDISIALIVVPIMVGVTLAGVGFFFYRRGRQEAEAARKDRRN